MGFYVEPTHYKLKFEDPKYAGLEIIAESLDVGTMIDLMSLAQLNTNVSASEITKVTDSMRMMFDTFAEKLVSWNLDDKYGVAIPPTKENVYKQEPGFIMMVIMNWMSAASSVDNPLSSGSNSGETSLVQSLTMEPLSPNL